jgi:hypothetical protein
MIVSLADAQSEGESAIFLLNLVGFNTPPPFSWSPKINERKYFFLYNIGYGYVAKQRTPAVPAAEDLSCTLRNKGNANVETALFRTGRNFAHVILNGICTLI